MLTTFVVELSRCRFSSFQEGENIPSSLSFTSVSMEGSVGGGGRAVELGAGWVGRGDLGRSNSIWFEVYLTQ